MKATIKLTNSAFFSLLLEGLEAYAIKHQGKKDVAIETHAQLWGSFNKRLPFSCEIKHISVDSSANKKRGSVSVAASVLDLKKDIARVFGDGYKHLGTFHTHPWVLGEENISSPSDIRRGRLFNFSPEDHICECDDPTITIGKNEFSIALVMTIFAGKKADDRKDSRLDDSLFEFSLGNIKIWLKAQIYQHKSESSLSPEEKKQSNIYGLLDLPSYKKQKYESLPVPVPTRLELTYLDEYGPLFQDFGRLTFNDGDAEYRTARDAEKRWFA